MNNDIENIRRTRVFLLSQVSGLSAEQLNKIPAGFANNIIWNLGHLIAAQQGICYVRAGAPLTVEEQYFSLYKTGTKPEAMVDEGEVQKIKDLLLSSIDQLAADRHTDKFRSYKPWKTRYDIEIGSLEEAIDFLPYHEGYHAGTILALKKLVSLPG